MEHKEDIAKCVGAGLVIAGITAESVAIGGVAGRVLTGVACGVTIGGVYYDTKY